MLAASQALSRRERFSRMVSFADWRLSNLIRSVSPVASVLRISLEHVVTGNGETFIYLSLPGEDLITLSDEEFDFLMRYLKSFGYLADVEEGFLTIRW